ncbi:ribosomal protein S5 domain 2-type protein [Lactarius psammicola]|nr:ribosomal protein S5 domain 2-type protein [Lactarius psammicola]
MSISRADGRGNEDLRPLGIVYERLARVDGSARFGFGEMEALASVSGPIEARLAAEQPSRATIEVNIRPLSSLPGTESKALAASLRGLLAPSIILSRNPRTLIQLVVQSLTPSPTEHFFPSLVAACINAASLALLNAGSIPMTGVVCATAVALLHPATEVATSTLVLDPSEVESQTGAASGCFAYLFTTETSESQEAPLIPGARLVWTNWHAKNGVFDEELLTCKSSRSCWCRDRMESNQAERSTNGRLTFPAFSGSIVCGGAGRPQHKVRTISRLASESRRMPK